jgi:hypothetical protein
MIGAARVRRGPRAARPAAVPPRAAAPQPVQCRTRTLITFDQADAPAAL